MEIDSSRDIDSFWRFTPTAAKKEKRRDRRMIDHIGRCMVFDLLRRCSVY